MTKYDIRVESRGCRDIFITGVDESDVGEVVTSWCNEYTTVVVTRSEEQEHEMVHGS